jgi:hypothetical protein
MTHGQQANSHSPHSGCGWELLTQGLHVDECIQDAICCVLQVLGVAKLGLAVIATFVVCWSPWLYSLESASQVCGHGYCLVVSAQHT